MNLEILSKMPFELALTSNSIQPDRKPVRNLGPLKTTRPLNVDYKFSRGRNHRPSKIGSIANESIYSGYPAEPNKFKGAALEQSQKSRVSVNSDNLDLLNAMSPTHLKQSN